MQMQSLSKRVELEAEDGFTEAVVELRVDDSVAMGTEQGADQGVDDGVAVDVKDRMSG